MNLPVPVPRASASALAIACLLIVSLALPAGAVADPASGAVGLDVGDGKAAKRLAREKVSVRGTGAAAGKGRISLPILELSTGGAVADAGLDGALVFRSGDGAVRFEQLRLTGSGDRVEITAASDDGRETVLTATGPVALGASDLQVPEARLFLTKGAARELRKRLGLDRRPAGRLGTLRASEALSAAATPPAPPAPSGLAPGSCPTEPVSGGPPFTPPGDLPDPAALPVLPGASELTGSSAIDWGLRASFRSYVGNPGNPGYPPAATPPILAGGGATINPSGTFHWGGEGTYLRSTVPGEDRVVIEGSGSVQFCYPGHGFAITISNPAVVIDPEGGDGRIVLDVGASLFGEEYPTQRVDFATLDLAGQAPVYSAEGRVTTWEDVPASLTADGAAVFGGFYPPGQSLDPVTVTAEVAAAPDPYAATCPIAAGAGNGPSAATAAAPIAPLAGAVPATAGGAEWGFKDSFQTYIWSPMVPPPPGGTVTAINGASFDGTAPLVAGDFGLPFASGEYSDGGTPGVLGDDAAVVRTSGGGLFCRQSHSLRIAFGQVAVVVDGDQSRLVADADANLFGKTQAAQRVTLAELDPSAVVPAEAGGVVTWAEIPATLTQDGIDALGLTGFYAVGEPLDPITVRVDPQ